MVVLFRYKYPVQGDEYNYHESLQAHLIAEIGHYTCTESDIWFLCAQGSTTKRKALYISGRKRVFVWLKQIKGVDKRDKLLSCFNKLTFQRQKNRNWKTNLYHN